MKVFTIKAYGELGGGIAIVAADCSDDAIALAAAIENPGWKVDYGDPEQVDTLPVIYEGTARALEHYETGE